MLKNYFKIAIKVLLRRKFFTFISLFGISFTLMILLVITAFIDNLFSPNYPETRRDRSLYVTRVHQSHSTERNNRNGPASFSFLNKYVKTLKTPQKVAITSLYTSVNVYTDKRKVNLNMKHTNEEFWEVMDFNFLEGKPYYKTEIDNGARVAVISDRVKRQCFSDQASVIGQELEINNEKYRIIGLVREVPLTRIHSSADIYVPYSTAKTGIKDPDFSGLYCGILLANSRSEFSAIETELQQTVARIQFPNPEEFDQLDVHADPYATSWSRVIFGDDESGNTSALYSVVIIFALLFMLLPTINLVNINSSRIMERASEIGVRKAFGASSATLVYQFIIENIIITFIGGLVGAVLAWIVLQIINSSGAIPGLILSMNFKVLSIGIILCLIFGFLSGVFPAFRMSRLHVINALKTSEL